MKLWSQLSLFGLASLKLITPTFAQTTLLPSAASASFPSCALSCTTLQSAQTGCIPPAAPVTDYNTYVSCFCQSSLISSFYSTPDGVCTDVCTAESDRTLLQSWYKNFCATGGSTTVATAVTSTAAAATSSAASGSSGSTSSSTSTSSDNGGSSTEKGGWFANHWKWVVMLIVLAIGFIILGFGGRWLRNRHHRKLDEKYGGPTGPTVVTTQPSLNGSGTKVDGMWAPHQATAHTRGWGLPQSGSSGNHLSPASAAMSPQSGKSSKGSVITKGRF